MLLAIAAPAALAGDRPPPPRLDAAAWLLYDAADRDELAAHRAGAELPMASTTKLMTAHLAREALGLHEVVTATPYDPGPAESLMGLRPGERVSVEDLLYGLLLASGNDAAATLAAATAGSQGAFVSRMNREALRLGLEHTGYENPIGFDGPGHHTSAGDLVELAIDVRRDPVLRKIVDTPSATVESGGRELSLVNRNVLVRTVPFVNGVKTGYTDGAGYVLVASGRRKGVTLVSAVLGAPSELARDQGSLELLRYGFSLYRRRTVVERGQRFGSVAIRDREVAVPLAAGRQVELVLRRDQDLQVEMKHIASEVEGPVARGDRMGTLVVSVDGTSEARLPLVAVRAAAAANLIEGIDAALPGRRAGAWGLLALGALLVAMVVLVPALWLVRRRKGAP